MYSRLNKTEEVSLGFSRQVRLIPITRRVLGIIHVGGVIGYNQYVENNFYSVSPEAHASVYYSILHRVKSKVQFSYGHRFYDSSYGNDYRNYFRISAGIHFSLGSTQVVFGGMCKLLSATDFISSNVAGYRIKAAFALPFFINELYFSNGSVPFKKLMSGWFFKSLIPKIGDKI